MSPLGQAIHRTLKYSDHFHFPLTQDEIKIRLIGLRLKNKSSLTQRLQSLLLSSQIKQKGIYYYLPGSNKYLAQRAKNQRSSKPLWAQAHKYVGSLQHFPWVRAIFITGSLAMNNTDRQADIDLFVITANDRLWLTRLLITIYTSLLGLRRTPDSLEIKGKFCLNLYLAERGLRVPVSRRSLYTAYELIQAVPLYDPHNLRDKMLLANQWVGSYLPNFPMPQRSVSAKIARSPVNLIAKILLFLETCVYHLQRLYMSRRQTHEYVTRDAAYFHPHNPGQDILV